MKVTGAQWNAYLSSWPEGQWYDDADETINGISSDDFEGKTIPDGAVVEFTCGIVYVNGDDREGTALPVHFRRWVKAQKTAFFACEIPKNKADEFKALVASIGGKARQS